jgi:hypothetical protein
MPHCIVISPTSLGPRGRHYAVTCCGKLLCESRTPIFAACRALLARGTTGRLEVWRRGKASADMQLDIVRGASLAICETATESLRVVPWRPRPDITSPNAVSHRSVQPPAVANETRVPESPSELRRPCLPIGGVAQRVFRFPRPAFQQKYRLTPIICGDHQVAQQGLHAGCSQSQPGSPLPSRTRSPPCAVQSLPLSSYRRVQPPPAAADERPVPEVCLMVPSWALAARTAPGGTTRRGFRGRGFACLLPSILSHILENV